MGQTKVADSRKGTKKFYIEKTGATVAADPVVGYMDAEQLGKLIISTQKKMENAAKDLDFMEAARLRDELFDLQKMLKNIGQ